MLGFNQNNKKLLIIEPDPEKRRLLSTYLSRRYECTSTDSIRVALDLASRSQFGVVLSAMRRPDFEAPDLIPHLK